MYVYVTITTTIITLHDVNILQADARKRRKGEKKRNRKGKKCESCCGKQCLNRFELFFTCWFYSHNRM